MKKAAKKFSTFLIFIILLALLYLLLKLLPQYKSEQKPPASQEQAVLILPRTEIQEIRIFSSAHQVSFYNQEREWVIPGQHYPLSSAVVESMVLNLINLHARLLPHAQKDLSVYGLAIPQKTIEVTLKNGQKSLVMLGDKTPVGNDYYMQIHGKPDVYLLSGAKARLFSDQLNVYWDLDLPSLDWQNIRTFSIQRSDGTNIDLKFNDQGQLFSLFEFVQPPRYAGLATRTTVFYELTKAWKEGMPYKENLRTPVQNWTLYGLQNPPLLLNAQDKEGYRLQLSVGSRDTAGNYYARLGQENAVFTLAKHYVQPFLQLTPFVLLSKFIALIPKEKVAFFRFITPEQTFQGEILRLISMPPKDIFLWSRSLLYHHTMEDSHDVHDGHAHHGHIRAEEQYFLDGKAMPQDDFLTLFQQMVSLSYESEAKNIQPHGQEEYSLSYYDVTGLVLTQVDFLSYDARYYLVRLNGVNTTFLIGRYQLQSLFKQFKAALAHG